MQKLTIRGFDIVEAKSPVAQANESRTGGHRDWMVPDPLTQQALDILARLEGGSRLTFGNVNLVRFSQIFAIGIAAHMFSLRGGDINMAEQIQMDDGFDTLDHHGSFADAKAFVKKANAHAANGHTDWVLPDNYTLSALSLITPGAEESSNFWSSSYMPNCGHYAWSVNFDNGLTIAQRQDTHMAVRLVRNSQCLSIGLAGQRKSLQKLKIPNSQEKPTNLGGFDVIENEGTLEQAKAFSEYANAMALGGHTDWVLPDAVTLQALDEIAPKDRLFLSASHAGSLNIFCSPRGSTTAFIIRSSQEVMPFRIVPRSQRLAIGEAGHLKSLLRAGIDLSSMNNAAKEKKAIFYFDTLDFKGTFEETLDFVKQANAQATNGHTDWMLPDSYTLITLNLAACKWYESNHVSAYREAWTSSPYKGDTSWGIGFDCLGRRDKRARDVRLVRASQCLAIGRAGHLLSIARAEECIS